MTWVIRSSLQRTALRLQGKSNATDLLVRLRTIGELQSLRVLDLGCGRNDNEISSQVLTCPFKELVSVDGYAPYLAELREKPCAASSHIIVESSILDAVSAFDNDRFSVALLLDVIEHLEHAEALKLISQLKRITTVGIVIFLPLGDCPQDSFDGNDYQQHRSSWHAQELIELGFEVEELRGFHWKGIPPRPVSAAWAIHRSETGRDKEVIPVSNH